MGVSWKWLEAGVELAGQQYAWREQEPDEVLRFHEGLLDAIETFNGMRLARESIESGAAESYRGAAGRLLEILREIRRAEGMLHSAALGFSVFFEPAGIMERFAGDSAGMKRFIDEAGQKIGAKISAPAETPVTPSAAGPEVTK